MTKAVIEHATAVLRRDDLISLNDAVRTAASELDYYYAETSLFYDKGQIIHAAERAMKLDFNKVYHSNGYGRIPPKPCAWWQATLVRAALRAQDAWWAVLAWRTSHSIPEDRGRRDTRIQNAKEAARRTGRRGM